MSRSKRVWPSLPVVGEAVFSPCGRYRYVLRREWDSSKPRFVFCALNPSKAGARDDDQSVRKITGFTHLLGGGAFDLVNMFALISTKPDALLRHADPVGPDNDEWLRETCNQPNVTRVVAWGKNGEYFPSRVLRVLELIPAPMFCLSRINSGHPGHPLMLPYSSTIQPWAADSREGVAAPPATRSSSTSPSSSGSSESEGHEP